MTTPITLATSKIITGDHTIFCLLCRSDKICMSGSYDGGDLALLAGFPPGRRYRFYLCDDCTQMRPQIDDLIVRHIDNILRFRARQRGTV